MAGPTGRLTTCYFVKPYPPVAATSSRPARASSRPRWRTATCQPLAPAASALKPPANCSLESLGPTTPDWYGHSSQQPPPTTISAGSLNQPRTGTPALFLRLEGHTFLSPGGPYTVGIRGRKVGYRRRWSTTLARAKGPLATVFSTLSRGCDRVVDHWAGRPGRLPIGGARAGAQALGTVTMGTTAGPGVPPQWGAAGRPRPGPVGLRGLAAWTA
jgi:hypothetical protein